MIGVLSRQGNAGRAVVFTRANPSGPAVVFCESLDDNDQTITVTYSDDMETWTPGSDVILKAWGKTEASLPTTGKYVKYACEGDVLLSVVCAYDQLVDHVYGVSV